MTRSAGSDSPAGSVDDVLITAELAARPSPAPDHEAENRALGLLAREMASNPRGVLQKCAELVMELCHADSAGVSILEEGGTGGVFRWHAIAGAFALNVHGTMPREASPCGTVMERDRVLLFNEAERFFPALRSAEPRIYENLLTPWHVDGKPVGTLWAIKHSPEGRFNAEDARILQALAGFAAAAYQMVSALDEANARRTELEQRTRALGESEARFRNVLDGMAEGFGLMAPDFTILEHNVEALRLDGRARNEIVGRSHWEAYPGSEHSEIGRVLKQAMRDRVPVSLEHCYAWESGHAHWLDMRAYPTADGSLAVFWRDVTDRKRSEEALRASEERYRTLFESMDEGVATLELVFDGNDRLVDLVYVEHNAALAQQTGLTTDIIGRRVSEVFPDLERYWFEAYERVFRTGVSERHEYYVAALDSWFDIYVSRVGDSGSRRIVTVYNNTTQRKRAEAAQRESERRQTFLLALSDTLRPLADPADIQGEATRLLREQLDAGWCYYVDWDLNAKTGVVLRDSTGEGIPSLAGTHDVSDAPEFLQRLSGGDVLVVPDYAGYEQLPARIRAKFVALGFRSMMVAPLVKKGRLIATLLAGDTRIRDWSADEASLLVDVAERTWAAVERGRAEAELRESETRYRLLLESVRDHAIFTMDEAGIVTSWPAGAAAVYGWSEAEMLGRHVDVTYVPEDVAAGVPRVERDIAIRDGLAPNVRWHRRKDGTRIFIDGSTQPLVGADGHVHEFIKIGQDVTDARRMQQALAESELRLRTLMEGIPQLVWRACDRGMWTWSSPQWQHCTGQTQQQSHGLGWLDAVHPDDREATLCAWDAARAHGRLDVEFRVRRAQDGAYLWHHTRSLPVRDENGDILEWLGTTTDVQQLKELQERQAVLVAELQHRTRNLMAVVRAMSDKTARSSADLDDFRAGFRDRLESLARVQGLLSRLDEHDRVSFDELVRTELSAMGAGVERVSMDGPAGVRLRSSTVQTLAMAIHELATNAVKYGALGQASGRLAVRWSLERSGDGGRPWLHIDWRETGVAMPGDGAPQGTGQGRELIERALPYQLRARTSYTLGDGGVHCTISVPVSASTVAGMETA